MRLIAQSLSKTVIVHFKLEVWGRCQVLKPVLGLLTTAIPYTFTSLIVKALASTSSNHLTVEILLLNEAHLTTIVKLPSYPLLKDVSQVVGSV